MNNNKPTMGQRVAYELVRSMTTLSLHKKMRAMEHCLVHHLYESDEWRDTYEYIYDLCKDEVERRKGQTKKEEELKSHLDLLDFKKHIDECGFI